MGEFHIITCDQKIDQIIIKLKEVLVLPFNELAKDLYMLEGEDSWQEEHYDLFTSISKNYEMKFDVLDLVVFEIWDVIYNPSLEKDN